MTTMWDIIDDTNIFQFDCDECSGNYQLPPPKFHIPPPPMPPSLKDFVKCNEDDFLNRINNWDNDMCDAIPTFDASFYSSPFAQTLILVVIFSFILILVIILSVIYVRRLIKQKNGGCKELKNLVKHHLHKTNNTNSNLKKLPTTDNYYEECYHCNEYTISRQAKDFIGYTIQATIEDDEQKRTSATNTRRIPTSTQITLFNPENYFHSRHNEDHQQDQQQQQLSQKFYQYSMYNEFSGYFNEPISRNNYFNHNENYSNNHINYNNHENLNNTHHDRRQFYEYSRTYEDFIELNNSTSPSTTITDDCSSGNDTNSNPEYVEIELVVPNLVLR